MRALRYRFWVVVFELAFRLRRVVDRVYYYAIKQAGAACYEGDERGRE